MIDYITTVCSVVLCVGMLVWYVGMLVCCVLVSSNKEISVVKSFFQCHTPSIRLRTVKSVCLAFRSPVMIILSAVFLMFSSIVVLMGDAGGIYIVDILIRSWVFFKRIVMASLSVFIVKHVSMISNLISLRTRIATPHPCLLGLYLSVMV